VRNLRLQTVFLLALLTTPAFAQTSNEPVVAFVNGTTLTLAASSGQIIQNIDLKQPVYNFALSKDRKLLVIVSPDTQTGGHLILLNLQTHMQTRLTNGNLYFKAKDLDKGETEVYDDPAFSPDGYSLAFAIHTDNPGDGNDAINDSGPLAVMDLQTRKVRVLKSTENIDGQGFCFANTPMWSPDGKWILFSCENGGFITDAQGTTLRDLKLGLDQGANTSPVSWVGNSCVLYSQSHSNGSSLVHDSDEVYLFNLKTSLSQNPASLMAFPKWSVAGLREASNSAFIRQLNTGIFIETKDKQRMFPEIKRTINEYNSWKAPAAHIIGGWQPSSIPPECK
jgi:Tol biopolymer transport system component